MTLRFWGRDAALWLALIQTALTVLVGFGWSALTAEQAALWLSAITAVFGVLTALRIRPVAPVAFTALFNVVATLAGAYGLHLEQTHVASINALIVATILVVRGQASPAEDAWKTGVLGNKVTTGQPVAQATTTDKMSL